MFNFEKYLWGVCKFLLQTVDGLTSVFYWFAGVRPATINPSQSYTPSLDDPNIFTELWNTAGLGKVFVGMALIGVALLCIAMFVGFLKTSMFQQDTVQSTKRMIGKSAMSFIWIAIIPLLFYVAIIGVSALLNLVVGFLSLGAGGETETLGVIIGKSCLPSDFNSEIAATFRTDMAWDEFKQNFDPDNYNYFMCIVSGSCVLVGLAMSCLLVVERIIHIFLLYIISPLMLAKTPIDDGKSMEQWRDLTMSKFLGILGVIICMYLFFLLIKPINNWFTPDVEVSASHKLYLTIAKLIFLIGGVFSFTKAGHLFAHLIAQGSGQFEGMSQAQTMGLMSMGGRLAGRLIGGAKQGSRMALGGMSGGAGGIMPSLMGGGGQSGATAPMMSPSMGGAQTLNKISMANSNGSPLSMARAVGKNESSSPLASAGSGVGSSTAMNMAGIGTEAGAGGVAGAKNSVWGASGFGGAVKRSFNGGVGTGYAMMYGGALGVAGYAGAKVIKGIVGLGARGIKAGAKGIGQGINSIGKSKTGMTVSERISENRNAKTAFRKENGLLTKKETKQANKQASMQNRATDLASKKEHTQQSIQASVAKKMQEKLPQKQNNENATGKGSNTPITAGNETALGNNVNLGDKTKPESKNASLVGGTNRTNIAGAMQGENKESVGQEKPTSKESKE
jgi:hypothetical protein